LHPRAPPHSSTLQPPSSTPFLLTHKTLPSCTRASIATNRENEVKQLNGWKATVDSLVERFQQMLAQKAALAPDAAAEAAAVADVAGTADGEAAAGDLETGDGEAAGADGRAALQAASVQVHSNKMR